MLGQTISFRGHNILNFDWRCVCNPAVYPEDAGSVSLGAVWELVKEQGCLDFDSSLRIKK